MGSGTRGLFLQIGGSVDNLAVAAKAGRSILSQFGDDAVSNIQEIEQAFQKLGGSSIEQSARSLQATYARTFADIRRNAQQVADAPTPKAAYGIVNAQAADQAAMSAEAQAASLRLVADAASRAAASTQDDNAALKTYAVAAESAAVGAAAQAAALREQAVTLGLVSAELGVEARAANDVVTGHNRIGASGMIAEHVIRSFTDSVAAGQDPIRALTMELPRVGEALQMMSIGAEGGEGALASFAAFMGGPWGVALTAGLSIAALFTEKLFAMHDAAEAAKLGNDGLSEAQSALGAMFDLTSGKLEHQNDLLRLNARLTALNLRAQAEQEQASSQKTFGNAQTGSFLTEGLNSMAVTAQGQAMLGLFGLGKTRDARNLSQRNVAQLVQGVQNRIISPEVALRATEGMDFTGAKISKTELQQAIIDASASTLKTSLADKIDSSLDDNKLDPAFKHDTKPKKERKPKVDHTAERAANADRAYQSELGTAQDAYAKAMLALGDTAEGRLAIEKDELQASLAQKLLEIDDQVKAKKINETQADRLKQLATATEVLQEEEATRKERSALLSQAYALEKQQLDQQVSLLQVDLQFADTRKQRLAIEQQMLAIQQKAKLDALNKTIADPTTSPSDLALAKQARDALPAQNAADSRALDQKYSSPIAAYRQQLLSATTDMNDALQGVAVDGLKGIEDGFAGIITGTQTVAGAFKSMAASILGDLAKIAAEKAIAGILGGSIFGGLFGGGSSGGGGFSALGSVGLQDSYAGGGHVLGAGTGTSDSILARLSNGEFVMNAAATKRNLPLLHAMNDGLPGFADGGLVNMAGIGMRDLTPADMGSLARQSISVSLGDTHLNAPGADPAQLARLQSAFEQSQRELPARATAAVQDAMSRLVIRNAA